MVSPGFTSAVLVSPGLLSPGLLSPGLLSPGLLSPGFTSAVLLSPGLLSLLAGVGGGALLSLPGWVAAAAAFGFAVRRFGVSSPPMNRTIISAATVRMTRPQVRGGTEVFGSPSLSIQAGRPVGVASG